MRLLVALVLLVAFAPAAPVPKELKAKKDDQSLIVGRWKAAEANHHSFEYRDDGTMRVWNGPNDTGAAEYRWTLDATATPKRMTWYNRNGNPMRPQFECVYELDGDELRINYLSAPSVPTAVGQGSGSYHRMTREQPAK